MEKCKGFTFNNEKNKRELMIIIEKRNKDYNDIKLEVKCGEILKTNEHKYLEEWNNEKGNQSTSIKKKKENKLLY